MMQFASNPDRAQWDAILWMEDQLYCGNGLISRVQLERHMFPYLRRSGIIEAEPVDNGYIKVEVTDMGHRVMNRAREHVRRGGALSDLQLPDDLLWRPEADIPETWVVSASDVEDETPESPPATQEEPKRKRGRPRKTKTEDTEQSED